MKNISFTFTESAMLREFFKHILTGKDGVSYDAGRAMGLFGGVSFLLFGFAQAAMGVYDLIVNRQYHEFPFVNFGIGFGSVATGIGILLKLKENSEPGQAPEPPAGPTTKVVASGDVTVKA